MGEIPNVCPKCGTIFIGNKCKCGWEVLPVMPKPVVRGKKKGKLKGVYR